MRESLAELWQNLEAGERWRSAPSVAMLALAALPEMGGIGALFPVDPG